jgi:hypothetical protein
VGLKCNFIPNFSSSLEVQRVVKANDRDYNEKFQYAVSKTHTAHLCWGGSYLKDYKWDSYLLQSGDLTKIFFQWPILIARCLPYVSINTDLNNMHTYFVLCSKSGGYVD